MMNLAKWFLLLFLALPQIEICFGEVHADLAKIVAQQKRNKLQIAQGLRQQVIDAKEQKDFATAKKLKQQQSDVLAGRVLLLPRFGEAGATIGTIQIEKVLESVEGGYEIATWLPRLEEANAINVQTGARARVMLAPGNWVYYPEQIKVLTPNALKAGERIVVRRTQFGIEQVSDHEIEEATRALKEGK